MAGTSTAIETAAPKGTPCLRMPNTRTEQEMRISRLFTLTACARKGGQELITIRVRDLEALIAIAAITDAGVHQ